MVESGLHQLQPQGRNLGRVTHRALLTQALDRCDHLAGQGEAGTLNQTGRAAD